MNAAGKPHGFRNRFRHVPKQPRHFIRRFEVTFGIGFKALADGLDGRLLADAGEDILQGSARRLVIQHFIGREQRHAGGRGDALKPRQTAPVVAPVQQACRKPDAIRAPLPQPIQNLKRLCFLEAMRQRQHEKLPFGEFQEVIEPQVTFALVGIVTSLAAGEQLA